MAQKIPTDRDLRKKLVDELSGSEIQSLLIDVFSERVASVSSASLLNRWMRDRFVHPSPVSPREFLALDSTAFEVAADFEPIELSPVCPLGTNAAMAPVSQNKVLGTIRNTEVVADSTNVMALECAIRRKQLLKLDPKSSAEIKLSASHRLVRTQVFSDPGMTAHFRVFSLCTAGRDTGSFEFESKSMISHISVYSRLFQALADKGFQFGNVSVGLYGEDKYLTSRIVEAMEKGCPEIPVELLGKRNTSYYPTASFVLKIRTHEGSEVMVGDGGFADWTQKLISNSKERLMISGIGSDRLISLFKMGGIL